MVAVDKSETVESERQENEAQALNPEPREEGARVKKDEGITLYHVPFNPVYRH